MKSLAFHDLNRKKRQLTTPCIGIQICYPGEFDFDVSSHSLHPPSFVGSVVAFDTKYLGYVYALENVSN